MLGSLEISTWTIHSLGKAILSYMATPWFKWLTFQARGKTGKRRSLENLIFLLFLSFLQGIPHGRGGGKGKREPEAGWEERRVKEKSCMFILFTFLCETLRASQLSVLGETANCPKPPRVRGRNWVLLTEGHPGISRSLRWIQARTLLTVLRQPPYQWI